MISHSEPIRCWCWNDGITAARKTAPSIRLIRDIATTVDGERSGIEINGYHWRRVKPASDGHPDAATDAALEAVYVARWQSRNAVAAVETTEQPRPSALSRIWAILRGRG